MSGWHPKQHDGARWPNPQDPSNPVQAYSPLTLPERAQPLYFGNGCDLLRPHVMNSLISENLSTLDRVGMFYDPALLINKRTAIEYIVQRGKPKYVELELDDNDNTLYHGILDPEAYQYNNGMTLCVVPPVPNARHVRVDLGPGPAPVLRNDYQELEADDWYADVPEVIAYYNGAFFQVSGLVRSQVALILKGTISFWIRPDGNDETGDGLENTPQSAFRTIDGCWRAVGTRFMASPGAHIAMRLGIPGTYEQGSVGPFGATVSLTGDPNNRTAYRIISGPRDDAFHNYCIGTHGLNLFILSGVNLVFNNPRVTANHSHCLGVGWGSRVVLDRCQLTMEASNPRVWMIWCAYSSECSASGDVIFQGNGRSINNIIACGGLSMFIGPAWHDGPTTRWHFENIHFNVGIGVNQSSMFRCDNQIFTNSGCSGQRYNVDAWSLLSMIDYYGNRQPLPGTGGSISNYSIAIV